MVLELELALLKRELLELGVALLKLLVVKRNTLLELGMLELDRVVVLGTLELKTK